MSFSIIVFARDFRAPLRWKQVLKTRRSRPNSAATPRTIRVRAVSVDVDVPETLDVFRCRRPVQEGLHAVPPIFYVVYVYPRQFPCRREYPGPQRPLCRRVVQRQLALVDGVIGQRPVQLGQLLDLRLDVDVDALDVVRVEDDALGPGAGPRAAVLEIEAGEVLQHLVEGLLLVLVGLAQLDHLVGAEFSDLVPLEDVVFAHPVQLGRGVVADLTDLEITKEL